MKLGVCFSGWTCFDLFGFVFRLDPALIRPGRVDFRQEVSYCSESQLQQMFQRFYPDENDARALSFARAAADASCNISAAAVQGYFMLHKDNSQAAMDNVHKLKPKS